MSDTLLVLSTATISFISFYVYLRIKNREVEPTTEKQTKPYYDFDKYKAFWKTGGGSVLDQLQKSEVNTGKLLQFYEEFGDIQQAFIEKLIFEYMKDGEKTKGMTNVELAFLGYDLLGEFMKQIKAETFYQESNYQESNKLENDKN